MEDRCIEENFPDLEEERIKDIMIQNNEHQ